MQGPLHPGVSEFLGNKVRPRFAVVISHPIQHFAPLFRELAARNEIDLRVFYCCDWGVNSYRDPGFGQSFQWDVPLLEGYDSEFLPIRTRPETLSFFAVDNPAVSQRLAEFKPDAVWIHGYSHRTSWRAYLWARRCGKRILYFGDSELLAPRGLISRALKSFVLPLFFAGVDRFLSIGDNNEAYYRHYGVPDNRFVRGAFPVDIARFREAVSGLTEVDRAGFRERAGLRPDALVGLFVGKFISIKRPLDAVRAVAKVRQTIPEFQLLMVGSGEMEEDVRKEISALRLEDHVKLMGFVNQAELPRVLWLGDMLLMCSEKDPHPLVVTECMSVGNAIIASDRVGCVGPTDAARPNENTLTYPVGDVDALGAQIGVLAKDRDLLVRFSTRSVELASTQSTQVMASAVLKALQETV